MSLKTDSMLRDIRNQFEQLIKHIPMAVAMFDRDMNYLYANERWLLDYGLNINDFKGTSHYDAIQDVDDEWRIIHHRCLNGESHRTDEITVTRADGSTEYLTREAHPWITLGAEIGGIIIYSQIITERKKAEDELKNQRNFLRQVIDLNTSFIFAKDQHGRFTLVNKSLGDAYGADPEKMDGKTDADFNPNRGESQHFHADDLEVIRTRKPKFIPQEPVTNATTGETRWYQTTKVPFCMENGEQGLLGVATDITERKRAQDELKAQHEFLRQVIDLNTSLIFAKDHQGRFTLVNKTLAEAYGSPPEEMVGKLDEDFNPNRSETQQFRRDDMEVISTQRPKLIHEEPVTNATTGETRWYQTTKIPIIMADASVQLLGVSTDITDRKKAEEKLQQLVIQEKEAREQAEEAIKMKDLFLANMSHELRTPLNAIIGFLREMIYSNQLDKDNLHMAERSLANSKRLLTLITSVLDLSRIAGGSLDIVPSPVSLSELGLLIHADLLMQAKEKGLAFHIHVDPDLPKHTIHDEERLIQIMTNLVINAIKFTDGGSINLYLCAKEDRLIIRVSDTGIGIPLDQQDIIFHDFVQLESGAYNGRSGAGLGLSIVKNLVDLMNGFIQLDSQVGKYTNISIDLPLNLSA